MKNVTVKVEGDTLTITVDLRQRHGPSGSGKTTIVASTEGTVKLSGKHAAIGLGLNVWTKEPRV